MIGKLLDRPVGVIMALVAVMILGIVSFNLIPVSLVPDVDIPHITVNVTVPDMGARELNESVIKPLRQQLLQVSRLKDIHTESRYGSGTIEISFEHGSDVDYLFIEVNEKVDQTMGALPKSIERPKVVKASATDIPAFYINASLKDGGLPSAISNNDGGNTDFLHFSEFATEVLTKRIEQLSEVAMVDVSGTVSPEILIIPNKDKFQQLGIDEGVIRQALSGANVRLGNLQIRDGEYRYSVRFNSDISTKEEIESIFVKIEGRLYQVGDLAQIIEQPQDRGGYVVSDGNEAVSLAVIKQYDARMSNLKDGINGLRKEFEKDYPDVKFIVTRDQTALLDYSIDNLIENIIVGVLLACIIVFIFIGDLRTSLLMIITIPIALVLSLLIFHLVGLSMNIISLSGLVLGVGMMSDNSVIVLDNIEARRKRGESLRQAIIKGTSEVFAPMLSSVLTTCSIFVPLIFMSGIAGALFYDEALSVSITLFASLAVTMTVIPVFYFLFFRKSEGKDKIDKKINRKNFFDHVLKLYDRILIWIFRHSYVMWVTFGLSIIGAVVIFNIIGRERLPDLSYDDMLFKIEWNQQIGADENAKRAVILTDLIKDDIDQSTILAGAQQFILSHGAQNDITEATIYLKAKSIESLDKVKKTLAQSVEKQYPQARYSFEASGNIFDMIFADNESTLTARLRTSNGRTPEPEALSSILKRIGEELPGVNIEPIVWEEHMLYIANPEVMALYDVSYGELFSALRSALNSNHLFTITQGRFSIPVIVGENKQTSEDIFEGVNIIKSDVEIPVSILMKQTFDRDIKTIISGPEGDIYPVNMDIKSDDVPAVIGKIREVVAEDNGFEVDFSGSYFSNKEMVNELAIILVVALVLLFLILASEFESLIQPLIIMSEIVIDIFGALLLLWICGMTLNIMSLIGIVIMSAIVINDSILKIDTINKLRKEGYTLIRAIIEGGGRRLKAILMTSLTTIFSVVPFLYGHDMGSDLQRPFSVATIGGMVVGTLASIFLIPVLYYVIYARKGKRY